MLFSIVQDPNISANELNHDLHLIQKWAHQWKLEFNPDPTKQATQMIFSCKKNKVNHPRIVFNGSTVCKVDHQKHLGLILEPKLTFEKHIYEKIKKVKPIIGLLKHLSLYLPLKTLDQMYKSLVRSHLDYCDIIYHIPSQINMPPLGISLSTLMEKVEKIQYQAALSITGAWKGSSRSKLYEELGWESLSDRRKCRRILQLHKIIDNKTPSYLKTKLPPTRRTFLPAVFRENRCRSNRYSNSFFQDAIKFWNIVISDFELFPTFQQLKDHMLSLIRPSRRSIFGIHDPVGIHYLFQLRLCLSPLLSHKSRYNFADTQSDRCSCNDGAEDTKHFILNCVNYSNQRIALQSEARTICQNNGVLVDIEKADLYLYGHHALSYSANKKILLATMHFIKSTKRFST